MTPPKSPNQTPPSTHSSGFGSGMLLGVLGGIAAYYFFGTDEGKKMKAKVIQEYHHAKANLPETIHQGQEKLEHMVHDVVENHPQAVTQVEEFSEVAIKGSKSFLGRLTDFLSGSSKEPEATLPNPQSSPKQYFKKSGRKLS